MAITSSKKRMAKDGSVKHEDVCINGVWFEARTNRISNEQAAEIETRFFEHCGEDLAKHYAKPSRHKVAIWEGWKQWAREFDNADVTDMYVCSANAQTFAISACAFPMEELARECDWLVFNITKAHNRVTMYTVVD